MNLFLYAGAFIFFVFVWRAIRNGTLQAPSWRTLLLRYETARTPQELAGEYLNIIWVYVDEKYTKRVYKFYATPDGLLITPAPLFFSARNVLIPWSDIQPGDLQQRDMGTLRRLQIGDLNGVRLDIHRGDFIRYIRPRIRPSHTKH